MSCASKPTEIEINLVKPNSGKHGATKEGEGKCSGRCKNCPNANHHHKSSK